MTSCEIALSRITCGLHPLAGGEFKHVETVWKAEVLLEELRARATQQLPEGERHTVMHVDL
eukprot:484298-Amphidinium_carterae.1